MALTQRERKIVVLTGVVLGALGLYQYVITPYADARAAVQKESTKVSSDMSAARRTFREQRDKEREWKEMLSGGLKSDAYEAEQQMLYDVGNWARESGLAVQNRSPERVARSDRTQIIRLRLTGTGTTASVAKLLRKVETAAVPLKVEEMNLNAPKDGIDSLTVNLTVSTIWVRPEDKAAEGQRPAPAGAAQPPRRGPAAGEDL